MSLKADHGDGSCKLIKSGRFAGKWRVQYTFVEPSGVKKRLSRILPTQKEGKDFLRSLKRADDTSALIVAKELTLGEWFLWLAEHDWPETLDPKTIRDRLTRYRKYIEPRWGRVPLSKIDPMDVRVYFHSLKEDGVGEHTRIALKANLVRVMNLAISPYKRLPHFWGNPFCLEIPTPQRREAVALSPDAIRDALHSKNLDDSQRAMLAVFLLAGLRLGEQMALTRGQICEKEGLILVNQAVKLSEKSAQSVGLPKGDKIRSAVLCSTLLKFLEPVLVGLNDEDFIWSAATENKPRMKKLVYATWRTIVKDAKLPEALSPHDCRLSHINMIEKMLPEVSTTTLKEHVGHSASGVTEFNYTRPLAPAQQLLREGLDRLMSTKKGSKVATVG